MIVGGYSLDLYCDNQNSCRKHYQLDNSVLLIDNKQFCYHFAGNNFTECVKQAKQDGWIVDRKRSICLCPICSGKIK